MLLAFCCYHLYKKIYICSRLDNYIINCQIYNYLCNQCLSPLALWVRIHRKLKIERRWTHVLQKGKQHLAPLAVPIVLLKLKYSNKSKSTVGHEPGNYAVIEIIWHYVYFSFFLIVLFEILHIKGTVQNQLGYNLNCYIQFRQKCPDPVLSLY
jgi:hypothetical protein